MTTQTESFDRAGLAKLIEDQAVKIAKLTELLTELRVAGSFKGASDQTKRALQEVDDLLGGGETANGK